MPKKNIKSTGSSGTIDFFDGLVYQRNGLWFRLPGWAKFFLNLGENLSHYENGNTHFLAALAVPTRSYASLLIGSGIVCGRSQVPHKRTDQDYFDMLKELDIGTPVVYRDKRRKYKAKKRDVIFHDNEILIGIQIDFKGPH